MQNETATKRFKFYLPILVAGLVGLSLILGNTASYGQTQKALIDLNTASEKELESIKGVGPATAKKIIAGRPYKSVEDLSKAGISAKTVEVMKPFVKVSPPAGSKITPVPAKPATPQKETAPAAPTMKTPARSTTAAPTKPVPGQKVNINTASKEQLEALPGVGPVKAQAIIDGRPYKTTEDVMKVKGIKEGTFDKIKDLITVK